MTERSPAPRVVQVLLTVTALEFFGPIVRDSNATHLFNPAWVGHARVHLVWLLGFMFFSGLVNLWLIWFRRPFDLRNLWLSALWQACNLGGFWVAWALADDYGGRITMPDTHVHILGIDENVFVFAVLSVVMAVGAAMLACVQRAEGAHAAR